MVPWPQEGITPREAYECLERCAAKSLVSLAHTSIPTGGPYAVNEITYRIAEGVKEAVDELLYAPDGDQQP
jgi:hypothetical protein